MASEDTHPRTVAFLLCLSGGDQAVQYAKELQLCGVKMELGISSAQVLLLIGVALLHA